MICDGHEGTPCAGDRQTCTCPPIRTYPGSMEAEKKLGIPKPITLIVNGQPCEGTAEIICPQARGPHHTVAQDYLRLRFLDPMGVSTTVVVERMVVSLDIDAMWTDGLDDPGRRK